jgi:hypothetical protein
MGMDILIFALVTLVAIISSLYLFGMSRVDYLKKLGRAQM